MNSPNVTEARECIDLWRHRPIVTAPRSVARSPNRYAFKLVKLDRFDTKQRIITTKTRRARVRVASGHVQFELARTVFSRIDIQRERNGERGYRIWNYEGLKMCLITHSADLRHFVE